MQMGALLLQFSFNTTRAGNVTVDTENRLHALKLNYRGAAQNRQDGSAAAAMGGFKVVIAPSFQDPGNPFLSARDIERETLEAHANQLGARTAIKLLGPGVHLKNDLIDWIKNDDGVVSPLEYFLIDLRGEKLRPAFRLRRQNGIPARDFKSLLDY